MSIHGARGYIPQDVMNIKLAHGYCYAVMNKDHHTTVFLRTIGELEKFKKMDYVWLRLEKERIDAM